jgi:peptidoglycan/xylan/chitin deacetylase (PgdA/CDA1 family)
MRVADPTPGTATIAGPISLRGRARHAAIHVLDRSGRLDSARRRIAASGDVLVLTFHRIVPDNQLALCRSPRGMVLRESLFARLVDSLHARANIISPEEADVFAWHCSRPRVLFTFDDAWLDNAEIALPYLTRAKIKACFFTPTSLTGQATPFWPERMLDLLRHAHRHGRLSTINLLLERLRSGAPTEPPRVLGAETEEALLAWLKQFPSAKLLRWIETTRECLQEQTGVSMHGKVSDPMERLMSWDQLRALRHAGHSIGSHTCTHALLPQLDYEAMMHELKASRRALEEHVPQQRRNAPWLSYPNGSASRTVSLAALDAGYQCGFLNAPGLWGSNSNPLLLPRINVWDGTLVDSNGVFSDKHLEYALFWRTSHAKARV